MSALTITLPYKKVGRIPLCHLILQSSSNHFFAPQLDWTMTPHGLLNSVPSCNHVINTKSMMVHTTIHAGPFCTAQVTKCPWNLLSCMTFEFWWGRGLNTEMGANVFSLVITDSSVLVQRQSLGCLGNSSWRGALGAYGKFRWQLN